MPDTHSTLDFAREFERVLTASHGEVRAYLGALGVPTACVDDLVQEIFIREWKGLPRYVPREPFEHWLMRLAVRACLNHLRGRQRWWRALLPVHDVGLHEPRALTAEHGLDEARAARAE